MSEIETEVCSTNLEKLRMLVEELETQNVVSDEYHQTLKEIEKVIKEEKKIISKLKKPENKLQHYETICSTILSILSTTKL
jgi:hypothetical protein